MAEAKHVEQERARRAYDAVSKYKADKEAKEIKSALRKLPSHIQTSGLAQTLLFYGQKEAQIARDLVAAIGLKGDPAAAVKDLVGDANRVRLKTREALAFAQWMKRFAEVLIEDRKEGQ